MVSVFLITFCLLLSNISITVDIMLLYHLSEYVYVPPESKLSVSGSLLF